MSTAPVTHVAVRTRDLPASIAFYVRYAGMHVVHERTDDGIHVAWVASRKEDPEFVIVLLGMPHEPLIEPSACDHFGFAVASKDEVDRIGAQADADGILKLAPRDGGPVVGYFVMVRDPSGNTCEFSYGQPINPRDLER